jgi:glycerophosphoryl diester phosphodiesterase
MKSPLVIAHRGASAYRPENTLEAFELGINQGADGIEFDLVTSKDQLLIIRHENTLSETTNVKEVEAFHLLKREGLVHGQSITDWFAEDFTLPEIKQLNAIERLADLRPGSAKYDNQFNIPTFSELLAQEFITEQLLVIELKRGTHLQHITKTIGALTADAIHSAKAQCKYVIESFDLEVLLDAKEKLAGLEAQYLYALEETSLEHVDLYYLAENFDGLTISLQMLFADNWVASCHQVGLQVWAYTARAEEAETSIEEYYEKIISTGVDAIFADHPDLLRRVLSDRG